MYNRIKAQLEMRKWYLIIGYAVMFIIIFALDFIVLKNFENNKTDLIMEMQGVVFGMYTVFSLIINNFVFTLVKNITLCMGETRKGVFGLFYITSVLQYALAFVIILSTLCITKIALGVDYQINEFPILLIIVAIIGMPFIEMFMGIMSDYLANYSFIVILIVMGIANLVSSMVINTDINMNIGVVIAGVIALAAASWLVIRKTAVKIY